MARRPNQASEFQGKETHAGPGSSTAMPGVDVWRDDGCWILHEAPEGGCEEIHPPRANTVTSHTKPLGNAALTLLLLAHSQ